MDKLNWILLWCGAGVAVALSLVLVILCVVVAWAALDALAERRAQRARERKYEHGRWAR